MVLKLLGPNGIITLRGDVRRSYNCDRESCTLVENLQAKAERDSTWLAVATLQEEGEVPAKKAANSGISADQEFKKIMFDSSDPTKMALIRTELDDKWGSSPFFEQTRTSSLGNPPTCLVS